MDWSKAINTDGTLNLQGADFYNLDYEGSNNYVDVYGYKVQLPVCPPDEKIINYGLPIEDQIFRKTHKPKSLNLMSPEQQDEFVLPEFNRRFNGVWIFIKGKKYYIPGVFYYFLNYWNLQNGNEVIFRITDLHFFLIWMHCVRDPKCLGLIDFKCRQIGDTEKVLCIIYEFATRYKNSKMGMQSIDEPHIKKSFKRMVYAHRKMDWFMKAQNKGSDDPEGGLFFRYPSTLNSNAKNKAQHKKQGTAAMTESEMMYEHEALDSEIQYGPSDAGHFDGQSFNIWYCDEFGKMDRMDPIEALGVITPALISRILDRIMGKVIMTSTVEELKSGKSLKWAKKLYEESDPNNREENGMTVNGLYRIFRSALDRAPVDRWGFPKAAEEKAEIEAKMKSYLKRGDIKGLIKYRRKNPLTIEDVFMSAQNESGFHIENLVSREIQLLSHRVKKEVFGNLKWKDGVKDSEVIWEPNPSGRWSISLHPSEHKFDNNGQIEHLHIAKPSNVHAFAMGVDPYDQKTNIEGVDDLSLGGIVVRRKYDGSFDGSKYGLDGRPENRGADWETERVVCDYVFRHQNPNDFYEDVILTAVYFGTEFLFEKNKGAGLETYIGERGYQLYIQAQPNFTRSKKAEDKDLVGITATENSVNQAFELLQTESCDYSNTIHHTRYLEQFLRTNWKNRGENDILMAGGWALVASKRNIRKPKTQEEVESIKHHTVYRV